MPCWWRWMACGVSWYDGVVADGASSDSLELLVAEELWNDHKKPFFFPFSSAVTCTNHPLEVDQRLKLLPVSITFLPVKPMPVNVLVQTVRLKPLLVSVASLPVKSIHVNGKPPPTHGTTSLEWSSGLTEGSC
ncbi:hypothetical protein Taro_027657 [Colocasia esculenta]|uniref:Uncharacterized protein n=1 Tax=Colocasia esculenta TaxID=4460 RepID=A0A843VPF2_COLES|nr:hypothetical protein [Colocasia esculenta]